MTGIAVLSIITIWGSTIGEEDHDLMNRFGILGKVILKKMIIRS